MWYQKLWNEKRWLFWLLLPIILFFAFNELYGKYQLWQAHRTIDKTKKKNDKLKAKISNNEVKIEVKKAEIESTQKKIEERKTTDIPEDWHENFEE